MATTQPLIETRHDRRSPFREMELPPAVAPLQHEALIVFGPIDAHVGDSVALNKRLDRALQSLWIAYQPIINWPDQKVFAHEALLRSEEPELPHPRAILVAAELVGRMPELGRTIRQKITSMLRSTRGGEVVFVNLDRQELLDEDLYSNDAPLAHYASRVVLEITERVNLDEIDDVQSRIAALRRMGFRIAIDDFGTGHSGFSSLAKLEPDIVKLDMSLVRGVRQLYTRKILQGLVSMSRDLGFLLIAEGVEVAEERESLGNIGYELFQGYLFGRPGPLCSALRCSDGTQGPANGVSTPLR